MILGKNVSWHYKTAPILQGVSFELSKGLITAFIGKSGAGKTTLLKCIANLQPGYGGSITCEGRDLKTLTSLERATTVGFVLQQFHLFPHFTTLQNCVYALKEVVGLNEEAKERAIETLERLGMGAYLNAFPSQLSGGQQQRVAIARAMVLRPKVLLLDEPTSALDPDSKKSLEELLRVLKSQGVTLALSSHDMPFVRKVVDTIYYLEEGNIEEASSKEKIQRFVFGEET